MPQTVIDFRTGTHRYNSQPGTHQYRWLLDDPSEKNFTPRDLFVPYAEQITQNASRNFRLYGKLIHRPLVLSWHGRDLSDRFPQRTNSGWIKPGR
jgi:hypothetical protein